MTYICFEGSRLLNLHLLKLAETTGSKLPSITENYVRYAFTLVQHSHLLYSDSSTCTEEENRQRRLLHETYSSPSFKFVAKKLPKLYGPKMLTYAVKEYVTVTETHIDARFFGNIRKYCKTFFKYNYTQINECVDFFESEVPPTEEQVAERYGQTMASMFKFSDKIGSVYRSSLEIEKIKEDEQRKTIALGKLMINGRFKKVYHRLGERGIERIKRRIENVPSV